MTFTWKEGLALALIALTLLVVMFFFLQTPIGQPLHSDSAQSVSNAPGTP